VLAARRAGYWAGAVISRGMRSAGAWLFCFLLAAGCERQPGTVLGRAPQGRPQTILSLKTGDPAREVAIAGVMVEKCPVAGCWFRLRDSTGAIKVDTKSAGFVVVNVPLQSKLTVGGRIVAGSGEVALEATGVRY